MNEETPGRHYARKDTVGAIFRDHIVLSVPQTTKKKVTAHFFEPAQEHTYFFWTPRPLPSFFPFTFPAHFRVIILH